jgi:hypothetical protein
MAKAPPPGRRESGDSEVTLIVEGTKYTVRLDDITARDTGDLRRETGSSLKSVIKSMSADMDIDTLAALVWLSRRQNGEPNLSYNAVAESIGYRTEWDVTDLSDDEDDDSPSH